MTNATDTKTLTDNLTSRLYRLRWERRFLPRGCAAGRGITEEIKGYIAKAKEAGVWDDVRSAVRKAAGRRS